MQQDFPPGYLEINVSKEIKQKCGLASLSRTVEQSGGGPLKPHDSDGGPRRNGERNVLKGGDSLFSASH